MTNDKYKKEITKSEYLQLVGIMELARQAVVRLSECDNAMQELLEYENEYGSGAGLLSDEYFEGKPNVKNCLKFMGIKVI